MEFFRYQHVEKYGNEELQDIEFGTCYIFPKIDFKALNRFTINKIKEVKPVLF